MLDFVAKDAIRQVQQGHSEIREEILKKYLPFILKTTSKVCKRYVRQNEDDEVSIALLAFNEALDKYDTNRGSSFLAFAEIIIRRRIIDYFRTKPPAQEMPLSSYLQEEAAADEVQHLERLTWQESFSRYQEEETAKLRRDEIMEYKKALEVYGISLLDLTEDAPKHQDARKTAFALARLVAENEKLLRHLYKTHTLPLKEMETATKISRRTMERQRKFIIALVIVLTGEYYYLDEYIYGLKEGS